MDFLKGYNIKGASVKFPVLEDTSATTFGY